MLTLPSLLRSLRFGLRWFRLPAEHAQHLSRLLVGWVHACQMYRANLEEKEGQLLSEIAAIRGELEEAVAEKEEVEDDLKRVQTELMAERDRATVK
eukprot:SAG22_NODE_4105_length_1384_cov_1.561089_2_plen_95_part_01